MMAPDPTTSAKPTIQYSLAQSVCRADWEADATGMLSANPQGGQGGERKAREPEGSEGIASDT